MAIMRPAQNFASSPTVAGTGPPPAKVVKVYRCVPWYAVHQSGQKRNRRDPPNEKSSYQLRLVPNPIVGTLGFHLHPRESLSKK